MTEPKTIMELSNVSKTFTSGLVKTTKIDAVKNISITLKESQILALVGESGSGKTTIANIILRLIEPSEGEITYEGQNIKKIPKKDYYRNVQIIFQDPFSSFNYFYKVDRVLHQAIRFHDGKVDSNERNRLMYEALRKIQMNPEEILGRYPHQLSGGQLQRFLLARILILNPRILIADEPTSMVDACARAEILNLLKKIAKEQHLCLIFITHDIGQAQYISDDVLVMEKGKIVEIGSTKQVFINPTQPYTKALLTSVPSLYRVWNIKKG